MIRFLHAADLHLDAAFRGLSPAEASARRQEQREQLGQIVALANAEQCELLLLAGDLFDSDNAYPDTLEALHDALAAFRGEIFISPGNHDCLRRGSAYLTARWPENVHIFRTDAITCVELPELGCRVYGAGFAAMDQPPLLEGFRAEEDSLISLMVVHGDCENAASPYNPITKEQIAASGLDYLALGHIHAHGELRQGGTLCAWPGCPMGRGFDETGEKGVLVGSVDKGNCETRFVPLAGRRYEELSVAAGDDPLAAITAALPQDTSRDIFRITLTGPSEPINVSALYGALKERFYILKIQNRTVPRVDLWAQRGEDTLRGLFLSLLYERLSAAQTEEEKEGIRLAAKLGLDAMDGREEARL